MTDLIIDYDKLQAVFDALVIKNAQLDRKSQQIGLALNRANGNLKVAENGVQISKPYKSMGTTQICVIYELSDDQTVKEIFADQEQEDFKEEPQTNNQNEETTISPEPVQADSDYLEPTTENKEEIPVETSMTQPETVQEQSTVSQSTIDLLNNVLAGNINLDDDTLFPSLEQAVIEVQGTEYESLAEKAIGKYTEILLAVPIAENYIMKEASV
ncbi:hypothetical protein [Neisseria sp. Ec49-e6-T10]|uniref:defense against restriction DarA-related protein n=1 Tax=Neisseria sp. Ec49-e6-T10 TaxID=3140744 RepID=UPI003EB9F2BC